MNLTLLDPFRRQIPDRIDSTLSLPRRYHPRRPRGGKGNNPSSSNYNIANNSNSNDDDGFPLDHVSHKSQANANASTSTSTSSTGRVLRSKQNQNNKYDDNNQSNVINDEEEDPFNENDDNVDDEEEVDLHEEQNVWHSCYAVSFNRRGTYLAAGHASGAVGVHDFASRTLSSIVHPPMEGTAIAKEAGGAKSLQHRKKNLSTSMDADAVTSTSTAIGATKDNDVEMIDTASTNASTSANITSGKSAEMDDGSGEDTGTSSKDKPSFSHILLGTTQKGDENEHKSKTPTIAATSTSTSNNRLFPNGITSVSWSRQSRTCLMASYGDSHVSLMDNTHPHGTDDVSLKMVKDTVLLPTPKNSTKQSYKLNTTSPVRTSTSSPTLPITKDDNGAVDNSSAISIDIDDDNKDEVESNDYQQKNDKSNIGNYGQGDNSSKNESILKRTRYVSLEVIDPFKCILPLTTSKMPNNCINTSIETASINLMTPLEKEIDSKLAIERTMEERHIHALMKMRLDGSLTGKKKKGNPNTSAYALPALTNNSYGTGQVAGRKKDLTMGIKKLKTSHSRSEYCWYQNIVISLPRPLLSSVQIHPSGLGGLACLDDGSLVMFGLSPHNSFCVDFVKDKKVQIPTIPPKEEKFNNENGKIFYLISPSPQDQKQKFVTCAIFDPLGEHVYAATKCGTLIGFKLNTELEMRLFGEVVSLKKQNSQGTLFDARKQLFKRKIPGGAAVTQIVCSRNGKMILVNSRDNHLRLYDTKTIWDSVEKQAHHKTGQSSFQPRFSFQDVVSRCKWASCDFSGDGEYIVGGCNNVEVGDKYELYLWNTATGNLLDQLTGPQISLYSLSWHPTRSFIAVGTSDGFVDIWGPRMDWTAFAPDFQALQKNVEYIEKEDEFDVIVDGDELAKRNQSSDKIEEREYVDVTTISTIPAFDSDSENEEDVFYFTTKIRPNFSGKTPKNN